MILYLDIETKSPIDLSKCGVYAYTEADDFEILLMAYAFDDEEVNIIELANGEPLPSRVKAALLDDKITKSAFNANFERVCLSKYLNTYLPPKAFSCTQALALSLGLPISLGSVAKAMNLEIQKDTEGKVLIKYFNNNKPNSHLEKWDKFKEYCKTDCIVERSIRRKLENYKIPDFEKEVYIIDQVINDRGVRVDTSFVNKAIELSLYNENILKEKIQTTTNIKNIKSTIQVKNYLKDNFDIEIDSVNKENVNKLIENSQNQELIEFLNLRQSINKTSIKKYQAMNRTITKDDTIKGLFQYYGANKTGRWSGRLVQVQNLPQTNLEKLDLLRGVIKELPTEKAYSLINKLNENTQEVLSKLIRTAFISGENKKLIISDFSAIEARLLSYLAREKWRIDVFNTHGKIYEASAAKMFNTDIDLITKDSPLRQKGKIAELALGYQGAVNALNTMGAGNLGIAREDLVVLVKHFRNNNPNIVKLWYKIEELCIKCQEDKMDYYYNNIGFIYDNNYLFIQLPSGRRLAYFNPIVEVEPKYNKKVLTYKSLNQTTKKYEKTYTYGGKLTENIVQGLARDVLATKILKLEQMGYPVVMHIHDEVVLEVDKEIEIEDINKIMEEELPYLKGLKLKADTIISNYYKK